LILNSLLAKYCGQRESVLAFRKSFRISQCISVGTEISRIKAPNLVAEGVSRKIFNFQGTDP
jgi:hypothetical protein